MNILVIDGQGGRIGQLLCERLLEECQDDKITAVGTNAMATRSMMKAGVTNAATGENSVVVCCRDADVIMGPVGIAITDSLLGEITEKMASAVGRSRAKKILIPVSKCNNVIVGSERFSLSELIDMAVARVSAEAKQFPI